jgi:hypothetical protein
MAMEELNPFEETRPRHEPACAGLRAFDCRAATQGVCGFSERLNIVGFRRVWIERSAGDRLVSTIPLIRRILTKTL